MKVVLIFFLSFSAYISLSAQPYTIRGSLKDRSGKPLIAGSVLLMPLQRQGHIDATGSFVFTDIPEGMYTLQCRHLGYKPELRPVVVTSHIVLDIVLLPAEVNIDEVYVTAQESEGLGTSSIIDKKAMELLQPSSFTDILELLPGGRAVDPNLTTNNKIDLRDGDPISSGYNTNALGTQFSIDGMVLNSAANMGTISNLTSNTSTPHGARDNTFTGIDMRSISTDNIEKVEIMRGIVSAEHGDLTSGAILIDRIKGVTPWSARMKADGFSKLFSIGKGLDFKRKAYTLNIDGGYLHANQNPTDQFTSFKRVNASARGEKKWQSSRFIWTWGHALDVNTTIDGVRFDPDVNYAGTDRYTSKKRNYAFSNRLAVSNRDKNSAFRRLDLSASVNFGDNRVEIDRLTQTRSATLLLNAMEEGSHEVSYLTPTYVAHVQLSDKPLNLSFKAVSTWRFKWLTDHQVKTGLENRYSKNLGAGQQYDLNYPLTDALSTRPRRFDAVPAHNNLAFFAEDTFRLRTGRFSWENGLGMRAVMLTNLSQDYVAARGVYIEPRWNSKLHLPDMMLHGKPLKASLSGGYGQQALTPTLIYLYPENIYIGIPELNYYHNNPDYRLAWANTTIVDPTNRALEVAVSKKWELGIQLAYSGNRLSVTYFRDRLLNGFRSESNYSIINYRQYQAESVDPNSISAKPDLTDFTWRDVARYESYRITNNGSASIKEGLEYQFTSRRLAGINTRFTVNGAWYQTVSRDQLMSYNTMSSNVIIDGNIKQYLAAYLDNDNYYRENFNTNLTVDSYLPRLGLNIAVFAQNIWWKTSQTRPKSDLPVGYYDISGSYHIYTEEDRTDPILRYFDRKTDPITFRKRTVPIDLQVNLKATKIIREKLRIAMFINRLLVYQPDYTQYGMRIDRDDKSAPYFGMELNLTL